MFRILAFRGAPLLVALPVLGAAGLAAAAEPGPHVHGAATLNVAVDGADLDIALESPLMNLLGFEHAPRSAAERDAVRRMAAALRAPALWQPTPEARCTLGRVTLASAALPAELLGEKPGTAAAADADGHADLDADFHFHCAAPERLRGLHVGLLKAFPATQRLDAQVIGPRGQSAKRLVPGDVELSW